MLGDNLIKYPRTPHLVGSTPMNDDEPPTQVLADLGDRRLVVAEKFDGANAAFSFLADGAPRLQSRGHFLTGGPREQQFGLFKSWVACHQARFFDRLGDRYIVYGEWVYAKHTMFYDALPHYFLEFDVLDRQSGHFLATEHRQALLADLPIVSAAILWSGPANRVDLPRLIGASTAKSVAWRQAFVESVRAAGQRLEMVERQTELTDRLEGLYLKVEVDDQVSERYKFVRASYVQTVDASGGHWQDRPILPNRLRPGVDIFAP